MVVQLIVADRPSNHNYNSSRTRIALPSALITILMTVISHNFNGDYLAPRLMPAICGLRPSTSQRKEQQLCEDSMKLEICIYKIQFICVNVHNHNYTFSHYVLTFVLSLFFLFLYSSYRGDVCGLVLGETESVCM